MFEENLPVEKQQKKFFKYLGEGSEYAIIYFKNLFLTIFSLGLYYPWAKVEKLKYHYQSAEFDNSRFNFSGTGKEVFKGFIKLYIILITLYGLLILGTLTDNNTLTLSFFFIFYLTIFLLIPFAIHGTARYRSSRSSWKGIYFKYIGDRKKLFNIYIKGFLLTIITFGIYGAWFSVDVRKYILGNLKFGNLSFNFKGTGDKLFWIHLKMILLMYPTLGIYSFWYQKELIQYYANNTDITQDGKTINFKSNLEVGHIFELVLLNGIILIFTLGIGLPWTQVRTLKFMLNFLEIEEGLDTENIKQAEYDDFDDATGEDFLDFLDIDLV